MISNTGADGYGSPCKNATNIVIFLTANSPNIGAKVSSELIEKIDVWNTDAKIKLFTYAIGNFV